MMSSVGRGRMVLLAVALIAVGWLSSGCALLGPVAPGVPASPVPPQPSHELRVGVGGAGAKSQLVRIFDESGDVWRVRAATPEEFGRPAVGDGDANLSVFDDENDVLVRWFGPACPSTTSLLISESGDHILLRDEPRDGCDAAGVTYGVVLSYDHDRDAASMTIDYPRARPSG